MAGGHSPHGVDRAFIFRSLEQQNAWPFGSVWVVLDDFRGFHAFDEDAAPQGPGRGGSARGSR